MKKIFKIIAKFLKEFLHSDVDQKIKREAHEAYLDLKARSRYGIH